MLPRVDPRPPSAEPERSVRPLPTLTALPLAWGLGARAALAGLWIAALWIAVGWAVGWY